MSCPNGQACPGVMTSPVTLLNGAAECNSCPAWHLECEARMLARMEPVKRCEWLVSLEKRRGGEALRELHAILNVLAPARDESLQAAARRVLALPTRDQRRREIYRLQRRRGPEYGNQLRSMIDELWTERRAAESTS